MTERKLRDYFDGKITADELSIDLQGSEKRMSYDVTGVYIVNLDEGEFEVTRAHLVKLCDDVISKKISTTDLNTIAFALMASEYFTWDSDSVPGERVDTVICEWDNALLGFDITDKNVRLWKDYLETGDYRLDQNELKQKFRSNGKYTELYQAIDEILWADWDPLGVNEIAPRDEYQRYTPAILKLKIKEADTETIAHALHAIEINTMGLPGNPDGCRMVAEKIQNYEYEVTGT